MCNPRRIRNAEDGDFCYLLIVCNTANDKIFLFHRVFLPNDCARLIRKRRADVNGDVVKLAHFNRARLHDTCAETRHLQHLIIGDFFHLARALDNARVGGVNAVNIRVNLAGICTERTRECNSRCIRTAAPQCDRVACGICALKARDDDDVAPIQFLVYALRFDAYDAPLCENIIRLHACHRSRDGDCLLPKFTKCHREQRNRDLFARCQEHVHLSRILVRILRDAARQFNKLVRRISHRRHDHNDLVARLPFRKDTLCYILYLFCGCYRASTEFFNNKRHDSPPRYRGVAAAHLTEILYPMVSRLSILRLIFYVILFAFKIHLWGHTLHL